VAVVLASRRANLAPPVDGVTVATQDNAQLERDASRGRAQRLRRKAVHSPVAGRRRQCGVLARRDGARMGEAGRCRIDDFRRRRDHD
jgi:hypothetical protein